MAMYRQRPQLVEAVQWLGKAGFSETLPWVTEAIEQKRLVIAEQDQHGRPVLPQLQIYAAGRTDRLDVLIESTDFPTDWLVRLPDGTLTLYSPDDFAARFERHGVIG